MTAKRNRLEVSTCRRIVACRPKRYGPSHIVDPTDVPTRLLGQTMGVPAPPSLNKLYLLTANLEFPVQFSKMLKTNYHHRCCTLKVPWGSTCITIWAYSTYQQKKSRGVISHGQWGSPHRHNRCPFWHHSSPYRTRQFFWNPVFYAIPRGVVTAGRAILCSMVVS